MSSNDIANIAQVAATTVLGAFALYKVSGTTAKKKDSNTKVSDTPKHDSKTSNERNEKFVQPQTKADLVEKKPPSDTVSELSTASSFSTLSSRSRAGRRLAGEVVHVPKKISLPNQDVDLVNTYLRTPMEIVLEASLEASDLIFDFTGFGADDEKIIRLENRPGSGSVVVGALCENSSLKISSIMTSDGLKANLPMLFEVSDLKLPSMWHVACRGIDEETLKVFPDYSQLLPFLNLDFTVLLPSVAEEVQIFAVLGQILSGKSKTPVVNCFDGVSAFVQKSNVPFVSSTDLTDDLSGLNTIEALSVISKQVFGQEFKPFEYIGAEDATMVLVVQGSLDQAFYQQILANPEVGLVVVKLLRPFSDKEFVKILPRTTQRICAVEYTPDVKFNALFRDVAASLNSFEGMEELNNLKSGVSPALFSASINCKELGEVDASVVSLVVGNILSPRPEPKLVIDLKQMSIFPEKCSLLYKHGFDGITCEDVVEISFWMSTDEELERVLDLGKWFRHVQVSEKSNQRENLKRVDVRLSNAEEFSGFPSFGVKKTDLTVVSGEVELNGAMVNSVRSGGKLVFLSDIELFELTCARSALNRSQIEVFVVEHGELALFSALSLVVEDQQLDEVNLESIRSGIKNVTSLQYNSRFTESKVEVASASSFTECGDVDLRIDPFLQNTRPEKYMQEVSVDDVGSIPQYKFAWNLLFKESFNADKALRPNEHGVGTAILTKFQRLTPDDYERNIFHLEFDISQTDIKYEIGDALGVFGENDPDKVESFISEYGLDPDQMVKLSARGQMADENAEFVSVRNLLLQKLDLFGKVQKKFYVELSHFAASRYEKLKLLHTGTDDAEQFKLGTYETVTYAELLLQYKSCKLSVADMIRLIPEIKARHYSISSSMKMNPRSVHLLVVAVDWKTPLGKSGEGQCTRYLKGLQIGQKVSVDIQKSVLRLPPNPKQPIVMAGLGTGMAPFRAFIQQRYWLKRSGHEIGPMVLYFGARHKAQEWLYGEELEEYERMGLLRLGLAWSRDQKNKVYIQHKIKDDASILKEYLKEQKGYFYLCGPTWPVPDVRNAIAGGLDEENAGKPDDELDVAVVEEMKQDGRYILEVY